MNKKYLLTAFLIVIASALNAAPSAKGLLNRAEEAEKKSANKAEEAKKNASEKAEKAKEEAEAAVEVEETE